ncbi:sugar kinase [Mycobacterium sp. 852013-51886_SCH5428379]|uniref:ROK family protein n=1 Tax=Mycobacterium sp. 852013-51886_SCH5428379 TaxID=1834111 RepID=UPI0007FCD630|nr:ROK family protein [Mycobacterium sp. 852013-51886_SCH5428379]OBB57325.1 sugar kinase [Mycobacterium sp. 852013-51886_SCH5428379]
MTVATLAVDVGGTKLAVALVDDDGTLGYRAEAPTPRGDAESIWAALDALLGSALAAAGDAVPVVGVASAGPIDVPSGTISPINVTAWQRFPIVERIATRTGAVVRLGGDGLCMALGECRRGAGRGAPFLLGIVVSTGVGGGLVLDGAPFHGRTGNAGHVGHVVVDPHGEPCTCGGRGCVETVAAGPRMVRWARAQGWTGSSGEQLADAVRAGDPVAAQAFERGSRALAAMIASVAAVCDLDLVVIGGGVARAGALLFDPLRAALDSYAGLDFLRGLRVVPAALGADAGLVGAAELAGLPGAPPGYPKG